jgi:outer membrane protein TolC
VNLGKSRQSELYSAQSSAAQLAAQLEQAKAGAEAAADRLALVMGMDSVSIIQPVESGSAVAEPDIAGTAAGLPEIKAIEAEIEAEGRRIMEQQGAFLPQVDLTVTKPIGSGPYQDGGFSLVLSANWPLFEGGSRLFDTISAYSREESLRQKRLAMLRDKLYDIKSRARDYTASVSITASLKEAYDKSSKSYKLQQKDYRYGMATNIEVIQAMTDMTNVKKALDNAVIAKEKNKILIEILK